MKRAQPKILSDAILAAKRRLRLEHNKQLAAAAKITETTLYNLLGGAAVSGDTLAKLQRAGVRITSRVIASLQLTS